MAKAKQYGYTDLEFINDLVEYFKVNTDKIDIYMDSKVDLKNTKELYISSVVKDRLREEIKSMVKYECSECKKTGYTSDTKAKKCHECGGKLIKKGVAK